MSGVEKVIPAPGRACWICGLPAVCGERLPGRRHKARALCQTHADAVFGADDPPWRDLDAKTQREIYDECLRGLTILAHPEGHTLEELLDQIAEVNQPGTIGVRITSPLLPGEERDLEETLRAMNRLRGREMLSQVLITNILIGWLAEASGQSRSDVLQRLALKIDTYLTAAEQQQPDD